MITIALNFAITPCWKIPMAMTQKQTQHLKSLAHSLKPVVRVGQQGVSASLLHELDVSLTRHELLKVKISGADREARRKAIDAMCADSGAECIQSIGSVAVLFRRNKKSPLISLPK